MILKINTTCDILKIGENMTKTQKIVHLAIFAAIASVVSVLDRYISSFIFPLIPGAKIGLANIVVMVALLNFDFKDCIILVLLKVLIGNLLFFGLTSFFIGGAASLVSFLIMYVLKRYLNKAFSIIGIGMIGAFTHSIVQLLVIMLIYSFGKETFIYGFYLIIISIASGVIMSLIALNVNDLYTHIYNKKENEKAS